MIARRDFGERRFGHDERVAVVVVEADRDVARQLDVLALVVADRDFLGVVQQDVGGHEHRIVEQADAHETLRALVDLVALLLELRHTAQLAERRDAVQQPRQLGVRSYVALQEQQAAVAAEAGCHHHRGHVPGEGGQLRWVVGGRERVEVDHAEDRIVVSGCIRPGRRLLVGPAPYRAEVVAERHLAGGLDARKDPRHGVDDTRRPRLAWRLPLVGSGCDLPSGRLRLRLLEDHIAVIRAARLGGCRTR